ncbi:uncharacterized protein A4U43_C07F19490 [Asparagus officinalis]|uniref:Uncharacterized protein n=1 Tax=Asparagus officinalis TaxID=4686 RepID=A0A5P1EGM4_ASPOF|nr:uncharacterized protein A4U43_C07F19490 [Asparagus officinalis]
MAGEKPQVEIVKGVNGLDKVVLREVRGSSVERITKRARREFGSLSSDDAGFRAWKITGSGFEEVDLEEAATRSEGGNGDGIQRRRRRQRRHLKAATRSEVATTTRFEGGDGDGI